MARLRTYSHAWVVAWLAAAGGCAAISGLDKLGFDGMGGGGGASASSATGTGGSGGNASCQVALDCPAARACHQVACRQGVCDDEELTDGSQCVGDKGPGVCHAGQCVECISAADCPDPGNDCKQRVCKSDKCATKNATNGSGCGKGLTCAGGVCIGCTSASDCGSDTFCQTFACDGAGKCTTVNTPDGTATNTQTAGDCHKNVCENGVSQSQVDNTDTPPDDGNPCTVGCINGMPNAPATAGTTCGNGRVCDGMGHCVGCINDNQCTPPKTCGGGGMPNECGCTNCSLGSDCADYTTCLSGFCIDAVCCNNLCQGTCVACNLAVAKGTCTVVPAKAQDFPTCDDTHGACGAKCACDGSGNCKRKSGEACLANSDCASGDCNFSLGTCT